MSAALNQFAVVDAPAVPAALPRATRGARFVAFVLDTIFASVLSGVGLALITKGLKIENEGIKAIWNLTFIFVYWMLPLYSTGQTLGKRLMKIRVISLTGPEVSIGTAIMRETFYKFVSGAVFCLGFVRILTHPDGRAWHDKFAKTRVVSLVEE